MPNLDHESKVKLFSLIKENKYRDVLKCLESFSSSNSTDLLELNFIKSLCCKGLGKFRKAIHVLLNGVEFNPELDPVVFNIKGDIAKVLKIKYLYLLSQLYLMTDQREISRKLQELIFSYFNEYSQIPPSLSEIYRMLVFDSGLLYLRMGKIDRALTIWEQCVAKQSANEDLRILFLLGFICLCKRDTNKALYYFVQLKQKVPPQSLYYKSASMLCHNIEDVVARKEDPFNIVTLYQLHNLKNKGWTDGEEILPDGFENMIYLKLRDKVSEFGKNVAS